MSLRPFLIPDASGIVYRTKTAQEVAGASYCKLLAFLVARTPYVVGAEGVVSDGFTATLADSPQSVLPRAPESCGSRLQDEVGWG